MDEAQESTRGPKIMRKKIPPKERGTYHFKVISPAGNVQKAPVDGTTVHLELALMRERGVIVVSMHCEADFCARCEKALTRCSCPKEEQDPICSVSQMGEVHCEHPHDLTFLGLPWPEKQQYPGGIKNKELQAEIARRKAIKVEERNVSAMSSSEAQRAQMQARSMTMVLGAGNAQVAALQAENVALKADIAETKAGQAKLVEQNEQILALLGKKDKAK